MKRIVAPEILDTLAENDPAAIQGRKDLLKVNGMMGNHRWLLRRLRAERASDEKICELGAGDGALSFKMMQSGVCSPRDIHAVDLVKPPLHWPSEATWHRGDLLATDLPDCEILVSNLFLHHFTDAQLLELGKNISSQTRLILAVEPARYFIHCVSGWLFSRLARLNYVTLYDMQVSIRAGFRGNELLNSLGLQDSWSSEISMTPFGANRVILRRLSVKSCD